MQKYLTGNENTYVNFLLEHTIFVLKTKATNLKN
jgi:hypothetical protein